MNLQEHLAQIQQLDDDALMQNLKQFVASSNQLTAIVLAHLAEVDARRAYRRWACDTLMAYCVYELRLSEDEAQRRCRAVRVARQYPVLFEMLADASIHLTGILLLAPYLTEANHRELLARARYRRKREIERLVAEVAPANDVPAIVELLRSEQLPTTMRLRNRWGTMSQAIEVVRHLVPGNAPAQAPGAPPEWHESVLEMASKPDASPEPSAPARSREPSASGRAMRYYKVQFTADQQYVDLLDQAKSLLSHQLPSGDLAELQRMALVALVEKLMRRKCGARTSVTPSGAGVDVVEPLSAPARKDPSSASAQTRYLPTALRHTVWQRDAGGCTFVDERGVRCNATRGIEFHHARPHARGGPNSVENIHLRCRAHNDLAAEHDFGREFMQRMKLGDVSDVDGSCD